MANMLTICDLGGANAPYEQILEYVGGRMPGGYPGSPHRERIRSWMVICKDWFHAFKEYNREI